MDALVALWLLSIIGAAGFTATGYFLARSRIPREDAAAHAPAPAPASHRVAAKEEAAAAPTPAPAPAPVEPPPPPFVKTLPPPAAPEPEDEPIPQSRTKTLPPPDIIRTEGSSRSEKPGAYASVAPPSSKRSVPPSKEHDHQVEALRIELRAEVVARHTVEARAKELESRLSSMSQQIWALRARATESGATKQVAQRASVAPAAAPDPRARLSARAPGLFAEIDELKAEVARLQAENESLRSSAQEPAPKASRASVRRSDLVVVGVLEHMVQRIAHITGVRAAAVIENNGLVLASSGDRGDALASFGTALREAASRAKRPSPLGHADEILVRDMQGVVFSSRMLGKPEAELALVTLASAAIPVAELRDIVAQTPGLGSDAISS